MLAQLIQKINNCFPTRATKTVVQFLYRVPISFHHDQTCFISAQLHDNENLRGVLEAIVQNLELNSAEWSWTLTTYHNTLIVTILFNKKTVYNHQPVQVGMIFNEKAQCIRAVKEYNILTHYW